MVRFVSLQSRFHREPYETMIAVINRPNNPSLSEISVTFQASVCVGSIQIPRFALSIALRWSVCANKRLGSSIDKALQHCRDNTPAQLSVSFELFFGTCAFLDQELCRAFAIANVLI
jgi:hypothetical protein